MGFFRSSSPKKVLFGAYCVDERCDIWAAGLVAAELMTNGAVVFQGEKKHLPNF